MKWIALLLWNPPDALDWYGKDGKIVNSKVASDLVVFALVTAVMIVTIRTSQLPPVAWGIVLIAGAMGARVFMAFLRSKTVTSAETVTLEYGPKTHDHDDGTPLR